MSGVYPSDHVDSDEVPAVEAQEYRKRMRAHGAFLRYFVLHCAQLGLSSQTFHRASSPCGLMRHRSQLCASLLQKRREKPTRIRFLAVSISDELLRRLVLFQKRVAPVTEQTEI
jgi:hypothetical protein